MAFLREHSLSIALALLWGALTVASYFPENGSWLSQTLIGYAGDVFGAFLIVMATKWLIERGSPQSKDD
jgi:hypothetical protein